MSSERECDLIFIPFFVAKSKDIHKNRKEFMATFANI